MKQRVDVADLQLGMFVAELDRPWLGSPFLFQGFLIRNEQDLSTLRNLCKFVYIESERSEAVQAPHPSEQEERAEDIVDAEAAPPKGRTSEAAIRANDPRAFTSLFQEVMQIQKRANIALFRLIDARRLGRMVETAAVMEVVHDLTETVTRNPNAALWLTKMREQDEFNATHSMNVAILSITLARHLGLPRDVLHAIGLGAMLHDIGLTEPSNDIIRRKIHLDEEDFAIIRRHPIDGLFSLKKLNELPAITRDIIRSHHERLDGTGYPHGLKGEEIPQHVRLVGLADSYDAMTSDRAYRTAMSPPDALAELHRHAEQTFGHDLVQSFIQCIGIYPVGTVVKLNTGAIAMVASTFPGVRLTPLVLLLKDSLGRHMNPRRMVNLATSGQVTGKTWSIESTADPARHSINIPSIAVDEMRAFG